MTLCGAHLAGEHIVDAVKVVVKEQNYHNFIAADEDDILPKS